MDRIHPQELSYTKEHEWCKLEGDDVAVIGITWHAQDALGDIVYCELPSVGEDVSAGQPFGVVESVKAVSDLYAPLSGVVVERNDIITEAPEDLNTDMYDDGWLLKIRLNDKKELEGLLSATDYEKFLADEAE